jgi:hypothetical protein
MLNTARSFDPFLTVMYNGLTSPSDFRRYFELHAAVNGWDDARCLKTLPLMLEAKAKDVYDEMTNVQTYTAILDELGKKCAMSKEVAWQHFWDAKREPSESLCLFATRLH